MSQNNAQRLPAEELFQNELDALIAAETDPVPTGWRMSPRSVLTYITGGAKVKGVPTAGGDRHRHAGHRPGAAAHR